MSCGIIRTNINLKDTGQDWPLFFVGQRSCLIVINAETKYACQLGAAITSRFLRSELITPKEEILHIIYKYVFELP